MLVCVLVAFSACTRIGTQKQTVSTALYRTETLARSFTYTEQTADTTLVRGTIADDYRYGVDAFVNGRALGSEITHDDARALRTTQPVHYNGQGAKGAAPIVAALSAGKWVVDPTGANSLWNSMPPNYSVGTQPIFDALSVLKYARAAMSEASDVVLFNPESQTYRPKFDPFPRPASGVIRYDVVAPALKPRDQSSLQSAQIPGSRYFRQMALYVRGRRVVEIREQISVKATLADPRSHLAARVGDYGIVLSQGSIGEQANYVLNALDTTAQRLGQPPLRERTLDVRFENLGRPGNVELPAGATRGSLRGADPFGQILYEGQG